MFWKAGGCVSKGGLYGTADTLSVLHRKHKKAPERIVETLNAEGVTPEIAKGVKKKDYYSKYIVVCNRNTEGVLGKI